MNRHLAQTSPHPTRLRVAICAAVLMTASTRLGADCLEVHQNRIPNPAGKRIQVLPESAGAPIDHEAIATAIAMWTGTCETDAPSFGPTGNIKMRLRFHDGPNDMDGCGDGCACTMSNTLPAPDGSGEFLASAITHLFERHRDGRGFCEAHRQETLAHEIGHVLGFRHPEDPYNPVCAGLIMSFSRDRSVRLSDCQALTALWSSPYQSDPSYVAGPSPAAETEGKLEEPRDP